ncbi:MAG: PAS domain S-box protein [Thermoanaerobaculales bacterium]|nr:PAS domain S-box protein [Thermoanaerobaculales bacterium]
MTGIEIDPRREARAALSDLLERFALLVFTLGVVSVLAGSLRVTSRGWHPNVITDLTFFVLIVGVVLLRKRLPVAVVMSILVALVTATAIASFLTLGLGTVSFVGLTACSIVVGVVFGVRAGFLYLGGSVAVVGVIGYAVCSGALTGLEATDPYLMEPQTWITQIAGYAAYAAAILVVGGALESRLSRTMRAVSRQAEELRRSEQRYRFLADNMKDVLFFQDMELRITYVSPSVERLFGYTPDETLDLSMSSILTPDSLERAMASFRHYAALAEGGDVEIPPLELEYIRKDGTTFWGEMTPVLVRDGSGRLFGSQGLIRDITQRRNAELERAALEQELRQSEKLRSIGQLAGGIAHDFNNQLAPIIAHADLLSRGVGDREAVAEHARRILGPARSAADLIGKLLAFARRGAYEVRPVDVHEVIDDVVEILSHGIDRRVRVTRHYQAASAVVEGDRSQLQNALLNLGLNARDALPEGGEIVFATRTLLDADGDGAAGSERLEITVTDDGAGMDEAVCARAFEPFFTTKPPGRGTGMGLAAVYGTVARHGGSIELASRPGQGTAVSLVLPAVTEPAAAAGVVGAAKVTTVRGTALVIDDEDGVRAALTQLLECLGYTVVSFARATDGIAGFLELGGDVDVVVLDLVLPDLSGRDALHRLQEIDPSAKVLLVSGYTADADIRELERGGTVGFLEKPFLLADLAEALARLDGPR